MRNIPAVEVVECCYAYGRRQALDGVSFRVEPGQIFGILGPNGSGKTTLFRILATLLPADSGSARVFGSDVAEHPVDARRAMGVVFQSQSLDPRLTVRENLEHHGHLHGLRGSGLRNRIGTALEKVGIEDRGGDRVETLSGGLRRRADLAKVLVHSPALLLLDEPSTGIDPAARRSFWDNLEDLRRTEGVTVLLTTHLLDEADGCDELAILDRGRLVHQGEPDTLKAEIGGEVVTLRTDRAAEIASALSDEFSVADTRVEGHEVRFEDQEGSKWAARLMERFGSRIDSVKIAHPTLEDVFLHHTGRNFAPLEDAGGIQPRA